jgi:hypothetical protein
VVVINRPRTAPFSLLGLYSSLLVSSFVLFIDGGPVARYQESLTMVELIAAIAAIATILLMPMRDPDMPNDEISQAFEAPNPQLRSPEDNLTLWQFMTVSWMSPLISLGSKRQLNAQDVWLLSYEFQHRFLHDKFRELPGSVLRRVLFANAIDLIVVSVLGMVELLASTTNFAERCERSTG